VKYIRQLPWNRRNRLGGMLIVFLLNSLGTIQFSHEYSLIRRISSHWGRSLDE
jgi:hypothetical protein